MHYGWVVVAASFVVGVAGYGTYFSFTLFYPSLVQEFGWTRTAVSGALSLGLIGYGLCALPMGWCVDRYGPRITVVCGGVLLGTGTALSGFISELWHLYALYGGITAIGMGAAWAPLVSTISRWFLDKRGLAIGLGCIGGGTGTFFVAPVVDLLLVHVGWREAYVWLGLGCGTLIIAAALLLERDPQAKGLLRFGEQLDGQPSAAVNVPDTHATRRYQHLGEIARTRAFWYLSATFGLWWFAGAIVFVQIAPYVLENGFDLRFAATVTVAFGAGNAVGKIVMGLLADHIGGVAAFQLSTMLAAVAMFGLTLVTGQPQWLWMTALFGCGFGGGTPQLTTIGVALFGLEAVGTLMGALLALVGLIGAGGPLLSGVIFDQFHSYTSAYYLGAAVLAIAAISAFGLRRQVPAA